MSDVSASSSQRALGYELFLDLHAKHDGQMCLWENTNVHAHPLWMRKKPPGRLKLDSASPNIHLWKIGRVGVRVNCTGWKIFVIIELVPNNRALLCPLPPISFIIYPCRLHNPINAETFFLQFTVSGNRAKVRYMFNGCPLPVQLEVISTHLHRELGMASQLQQLRWCKCLSWEAPKLPPSARAARVKLYLLEAGCPSENEIFPNMFLKLVISPLKVRWKNWSCQKSFGYKGERRVCQRAIPIAVATWSYKFPEGQTWYRWHPCVSLPAISNPTPEGLDPALCEHTCKNATKWHTCAELMGSRRSSHLPLISDSAGKSTNLDLRLESEGMGYAVPPQCFDRCCSISSESGNCNPYGFIRSKNLLLRGGKFRSSSFERGQHDVFFTLRKAGIEWEFLEG